MAIQLDPIAELPNATRPGVCPSGTFFSRFAMRHLKRLVGRAACSAAIISGLSVNPISSNELFGSTETIGESIRSIQDETVELDLIEEKVFRAATERAARSVVQIETIGGAERVGTISLGNAPTAGVIVSQDGYIVSSQFSFTRIPSAILVNLPDGDRLPAKLIATDHSRGLVLLKIEAEQELKPADMVPRSELQVGQWTIAVGRAYSPDSTNVSIGILSAKDRIWGKAIQTDAKISPANYGGALIDSQGRVIGVLSPLSNRGEQAIAGTEWYDSGIGFAIPLDGILERFPEWQTGQDIYPGKLGVTFQGSNLYTDSAIVENVLPGSPAELAGLRTDDQITRVNQTNISRLAQLRHAFGNVDAGRTVAIRWQRGDQEFEKPITFAKEIKPYFFSHLGLVPEFFSNPSDDEIGIEIQAVIEGSPAMEAGLKANDRILAIQGQITGDLDEAHRLLAQLPADSPISISFVRDGEKEDATLELAAFPILDEEQIARLSNVPSDSKAELQACEVVSIKLPEEEHDCFAIVPPVDDPKRRFRLLVWIPPAGNTNRDQLEKDWRRFCHETNTILFVPDSGERKAWNSGDVEFLRTSIDELLKRYKFLPSFAACGGTQSGGSLAMLLAFNERDLFRGLACYDVNPVLSLAKAETRPNQRLLLFEASQSTGDKGSRADFFRQLEKNGHPISSQKREQNSVTLSEIERMQLANWLDLLGRF